MGSEHDLVNRTKGDSINPWLRYKGKIKLFKNQNWPTSHMGLIRDAELVNDSDWPVIEKRGDYEGPLADIANPSQSSTRNSA